MLARIGSASALAALLALIVVPVVSAQQSQPPSPPPQQQSKPKTPAKKAKVWTDDDLQVLRKPWDDYTDQKAQTEQAADATANPPEKALPAKKEKPATRDEYIPPKTAEEAESRIAAKQREINYQFEAIAGIQQEYDNEPNEQIREGLKKKLDQMNTDLKEAQTHLKLLEGNQQDLKSKPQ